MAHGDAERGYAQRSADYLDERDIYSGGSAAECEAYLRGMLDAEDGSDEMRDALRAQYPTTEQEAFHRIEGDRQ